MVLQITLNLMCRDMCREFELNGVYCTAKPCCTPMAFILFERKYFEECFIFVCWSFVSCGRPVLVVEPKPQSVASKESDSLQ